MYEIGVFSTKDRFCPALLMGVGVTVRANALFQIPHFGACWWHDSPYIQRIKLDRNVVVEGVEFFEYLVTK